jgi:drug/metabolite transporter (DMT)-like permease
MPTWSAIMLAVAATVLINWGFVLQKQGGVLAARKAEGRGGSLLKERVWRAGIIIMTAGWGLYFVSVRFAPISIVQPALGAGMAVLALFSVFYLREKISALEWTAFGGMLAGIVLLGLSAGEGKAPAAPSSLPLWSLTAVLVLLAAALYYFGHLAPSARVRADALLGISAGLLIGLGSLYIKAMFNCLDESNLAEGLSVAARAAELGRRRLIGFGLYLPMVIAGNVLGIWTVQLGFRRGKALVVVPLQQVTNKATAIIGGIAALGETLPEDARRATMRLAAFIIILLATAALARFGGETAASKMSAGDEAKTD